MTACGDVGVVDVVIAGAEDHHCRVGTACGDEEWVVSAGAEVVDHNAAVVVGWGSAARVNGVSVGSPARWPSRRIPQGGGALRDSALPSRDS